MKHNYIILSFLLIFLAGFQLCFAQQQVEKWNRFELSLQHDPKGNPFMDDELTAVFQKGEKRIQVSGFYDGDGTYKIRFMPAETGVWTYQTSSNVDELNGISGKLECVNPSPNNHGLVQVQGKYHFKYADGKPYYPFGTTIYSFIHQPDSQIMLSLDALDKSSFNKLRFCVFPQWHDHSELQIPYFPFAKKVESSDTIIWDTNTFDPRFFQHMEKRIDQLKELGIEADVILFHPYDGGHWGFDNLGRETDNFYLKYLVARLSSFSNVWWSMANEYDLLPHKSLDDWDSYIGTVSQEDPYHRLLSVHNCKIYYPNWDPRLTHASIQNGALVEDFGRAVILRDAYKKPLIYDEVCYEGDIEYRWGNLSAKELVHRFWQGFIAGTYVGHGEIISGDDGLIHLAIGGHFKGESPERIAFLRTLVEETGALEAVDHFWGVNNTAISEKGDILVYFGKETPSDWSFSIPKETGIAEGTRYHADIIDTWNMTVTPVPEVFVTTKVDGYKIYAENGKTIELPAKKYMAIHLKQIKTD